VAVNAVSVGFIVFPFPFENIAIYVVKFPFAVGFVIFPFTFVSRSIRPSLNAKAIPYVSSSFGLLFFLYILHHKLLLI
jgi:hypothetical protein